MFNNFPLVKSSHSTKQLSIKNGLQYKVTHQRMCMYSATPDFPSLILVPCHGKRLKIHIVPFKVSRKFFFSQNVDHRPDFVAHASNPNPGMLRQKDLKFKASLYSIAKLSQKVKINVDHDILLTHC